MAKVLDKTILFTRAMKGYGGGMRHHQFPIIWISLNIHILNHIPFPTLHPQPERHHPLPPPPPLPPLSIPFELHE